MNIQNYFIEHKYWKLIKNRLKSTELRNGASLYLVLKTFIQQLFDPDLNIMACGIAYNFLMSLFPGIIFLFTLIPYFPIENLTENMQLLMSEILPSSLYEFTWSTVEDIVSKPRGGLLSIGFIGSLYLSTNAMIAIMESFNHCYTTKESRSWLVKRGIALFLTVLLSIVVLVAIIVIIFGDVIINSLKHFDVINESLLTFTSTTLPYLVTVVLIYLVISIIYYFAPAVKNKFSFFSIGSSIASILIIFISQIFSYYVNNFGSYNKLYGSIGALVGLMVLFYAISYMILLGYQLNASIDHAMHKTLEEKK